MRDEWRMFTRSQRLVSVSDVALVLACVAFTFVAGLPLGAITLVSAVVGAFFTGSTWSMQAETQWLREQTAASQRRRKELGL